MSELIWSEINGVI